MEIIYYLKMKLANINYRQHKRNSIKIKCSST